MLLGSEVFFKESSWIQKVQGKKIGFMGHAASVTQNMSHTLSLLLNHPDINVTALFSPQHGLTGTKQANMITHEDSSLNGLPIFSLYSKKTRRFTPQMLSTFDVLLVDLQDTGCRIYTYLTTLFYALEDGQDKTIIILDRPNPLRRKVEGSLLKDQFTSFVGAAPLPISHGLTLGEAASWFKNYKKLKTNLIVIPMKDYSPEDPWPLPWVQPSPNMTEFSTAQCYPGTVLLEGTNISEGRGTTLPLEVFGIPYLKTEQIKKRMEEKGAEFLTGCALRPHEFEPVFDKYKGEICRGFQIHLNPSWRTKGPFRPYRLISLFLKCLYEIQKDFEWKKPPPYEYEFEKWPIDILSGCDRLRKWIEDPNSSVKEWNEWLTEEETQWQKERAPFLLY
ncbi:MAG: DUF1343 domain-containing protein [Bdellovibrionales bacterium]|nr:DUF1343 domain-containing protein [Bdellovibrionales bacterium]